MGVTASRTDEYATADDPSDTPLEDSSQSLSSDDPHGSSLANITTTEFVWAFGGSSVYVTGAWDDWRVKAALSRTSPTEFTAVLALPVGTFQYKFIVDGNWKHSPALPTERDQHGNLNNIVVVKANVPEYDSNVQPYPDKIPNSPVESYDFSILPQEDHTTEPPMLPRLLASAPLDRVTDKACHGADFVRFNHMFSTNSDSVYGPQDLYTLASETRYKNKVITTILITSPNKAQDQVAVPIQHSYRPERTDPLPITNQPMGESQSSQTLIFDALNNV